METSKSPEHRVLDALFRQLSEDPTFPRNTLKQLERARDSNTLREVKEILGACRLAGEENATDIPS